MKYYACQIIEKKGFNDWSYHFIIPIYRLITGVTGLDLIQHCDYNYMSTCYSFDNGH